RCRLTRDAAKSCSESGTTERSRPALGSTRRADTVGGVDAGVRAGGGERLERHTFRAMGTDAAVVALDGPPGLAASARPPVETLEAKWSRFRPTSELCRLNDAAGAPVAVSRETFGLVERA